jgi:hypothetical protein
MAQTAHSTGYSAEQYMAQTLQRYIWFAEICVATEVRLRVQISKTRHRNI